MRIMYLLPSIPIFLLIVELLFLFFFSKKLLQSLTQLIYSFTKNKESTIQALAILFLPGTIIHELSHALTAGVLMVHVGNIEFMPEIRENGVKLGSAEIGKTDPFRRALIGVAPILLGILLMIGAIWYVFIFSAADGISLIKFLLTLYLVFQISNTMFSSPKDLEGFVEVFALIISLFLALYFLNIHQPFNWMYDFIVKNVEIIKKINLFLLLPLTVDLTIYFLAKVLIKKRF